MITGDIKAKVDQLWDKFWSGGISNPLSVIEQISYLLFIKRLDDLQITQEKKALRTKKEIKDPIFTAEQQLCRWSYFKNLPSEKMLEAVRDHAFPFIKNMGISGGTYATHMKDATFMITNPALLSSVIEKIAEIPMEDRDTKGDLYEYMLSKLSTSGQNGQFRTPRHIIKMMVNLMQPNPLDLVCDPACGTAGFLVAVAEYLQNLKDENGAFIINAPGHQEHFKSGMFHGFDFDPTMLRIGSMNMMLHGIEDPKIEARDSLSADHGAVEEQFTLILANPPFKGSIDEDSIAKDLTQIVNTKKTEILFLALFLRLLKKGGRAAVIVPDGVLFGSSTAHKTIRKELVENHQLEAVISMPSGVFKPYAGVSTAILIFTKTAAGGTEQVWFYDMQADGFSLDDKRQEIEANDIPDLLEKWRSRHNLDSNNSEQKCFLIDKNDIVKNGYDLSINRYKNVEYEEVSYEKPQKILEKLRQLETEINTDLNSLEELLLS